MKYTDYNALQYFTSKILTKLSSKSDVGHTHERVNGLKLVVSTTKPTQDDRTIITFVK